MNFFAIIQTAPERFELQIVNATGDTQKVLGKLISTEGGCELRTSRPVTTTDLIQSMICGHWGFAKWHPSHREARADLLAWWGLQDHEVAGHRFAS